MLRLFADNLLPVFLAVGAGYLLASRSVVDVRSLSRVAFFILAPCLIFQVIVDNELPGGDLLRMVSFALLTVMLPATAAWFVARLAGWSRPLTAAVGLAVWPAIGLEGVARQAGVLQSAMPSAVICTVLATEYDTEPGFVVVTTLLSPLTLTPLLAHLAG